MINTIYGDKIDKLSKIRSKSIFGKQQRNTHQKKTKGEDITQLNKY